MHAPVFAVKVSSSTETVWIFAQMALIVHLMMGLAMAVIVMIIVLVQEYLTHWTKMLVRPLEVKVSEMASTAMMLLALPAQTGRLITALRKTSVLDHWLHIALMELTARKLEVRVSRLVDTVWMSAQILAVLMMMAAVMAVTATTTVLEVSSLTLQMTVPVRHWEERVFRKVSIAMKLMALEMGLVVKHSTAIVRIFVLATWWHTALTRLIVRAKWMGRAFPLMGTA